MTVRPRLNAALPTVLPLLLLAAGAHAEPSSADRALAEALFREGRRAMEDKRYADACPKLAESQRIDPRLGTLLNLAMCHELDGKTASAWAEFLDVAARARKAGEDDRAVYARDHAARLEPKLARIRIRVAPGTEGEVELDDRTIGSGAWGTALPVDPGEHRVSLTSAGARRSLRTVRVPEGPSTIDVDLASEDESSRSPSAPTPKPAPHPSVAPAEPRPDVARSRGGAQRTAGLGLIGLGVAGAAVGTLFGIRTIGWNDESDRHCVGTFCNATGIELRQDAREAATASTVSFVVAAVAVGAGVALLLTAR